VGKLVKIKSTQYAEEADQQKAAYVAIPRNVWFYAKEPLVRTSLSGKEDYNLSGQPWDYFQASKEHFEPSGHREVLPFTSGTDLLHTISSKVALQENRVIMKLSEDGAHPFDGSIHLSIRAVEADEHDGGTQKSPHGTVWLALGDPESHDFNSDALYLNLALEAVRLDRVAEELIARPGAALSVRLKFSLYQDQGEYRFAEYWMRQTFLLEPDFQTPIVEYEVTVVDGESEKPEPPCLEDDADGQQSPVSLGPVIVDNSLVSQRLNWVIGLLARLVVLVLFK
jgi:hypothetical protein